MTVVELRPYQDTSVCEIRDVLAAVRACLYQGQTGSGKTVTFAFIAKSASSYGNRVLILAHRDALIKQASRKLTDYGVEHGIIMAGYTPKPYCLVQVGSVQSFIRRIRKHPHLYQFDLVIIDEAHLSMAKSYRDIVAALPDAKILGVTATPSRLDGKGLGTHAGGYYDKMVLGPAYTELVGWGNLLPPIVYAPKVQIDLSEVKTVRGEFDEDQVVAMVDKPTITGSAVEHYLQICPDVPAVGWCINIKHAQHVAEQFNAAGIPSIALHGEHTGDERDAAMAKLVSGELKCVFFCQLLIEGVDCPAIGCIILLRPSRSLVSYRQVCGRGSRPDPDNPEKKVFYILDHAGLTWMHGFIDEEIPWTLDGAPKRKGKKKDAGAVVKIAQCPECFHVFPPAPNCPACGIEMPKRERKVEQVDGKLGLITKEEKAAMQRGRKVDISKAKTLEELKALAEKFGYSEKWAEIKWEFKRKAREQFKSTREREWDSRFAEYDHY